MAKYRLTDPDGATYEVTAPDSASEADVLARFKVSTTPRGPDPTEGMSGVGKFAAGAGKAIYDAGRGIGQAVGLFSQADIDEAKRLDAPLMNSGAGMAGNVTGNIAAFLPTVMIPGAAGVRGAAAIGSAMGAIQPVATGESRLANTAIGGAAGAGGVVLGRAAMGAAQGVKALAEPFMQSGRTKIAGRMIQRFADDPSRVASTTSNPTLTGARPTLAEQTGDAGLARLQDSLRSVDPQINNQIGQRLSDNNAARIETLRGLTGQDGARAFADANRGATAQQIYGDAFKVAADAAPMTPAQERAMASLRRRPAIRSAMNEARTIAADKGRNIGPANGSGSIEGLHTMKMALDDAIEAAKMANKTNKAASITTARDQLVSFIEELSPDYRTARKVYAEMSRPVNQMDIAGEVFRRATSNTSDLAGNPRLMANALLGSLRNEPALIKQATGRSLGNALSEVMEPQQLAALRAVAGEADRAAAVSTAGNGPGSATAQRMASQNILRQMIGPTGLPDSWAESAIANTVIGKPFNLIYGGVAEPKIQQELAGAVLDPAMAQRALAAAKALPPAQQNALIEFLQQIGGGAARSIAPALAVTGQR